LIENDQHIFALESMLGKPIFRINECSLALLDNFNKKTIVEVVPKQVPTGESIY